MLSTGDTIVAIATPPGRGGLGVVRLSGPEAIPIVAALCGRARPLEPRRATFAKLRPLEEAAGDEVVVTSFPGPASYTGEDVVEISAHGSPVVLDGIVRRAVSAGARLAAPGEFTLRAFLHGKRDLIQAEAVADLVDADTPRQAQAAFEQLEGSLSASIRAISNALFDLMARLEASLDFPEEGFHFVQPGEVAVAIVDLVTRIDRLLGDSARGRLVREGAMVAIVGAPNVGKSSLFNALANANRAIVTPVAGTTRDLLTEQVDIFGYSLGLVDTAGIREAEDVVEREGVERARGALAAADLVVVVLDRSRPLAEGDWQVLTMTAARRRLVVVNKSDLPPAWECTASGLREDEGIPLSVRTGAGVEDLARRLVAALGVGEQRREPPRLTNLRHVRLLERAREGLEAARRAAAGSGPGLSEEFLLADLQEAQAALDEVTGRRTSDELLRHIFERFCIGK